MSGLGAPNVQNVLVCVLLTLYNCHSKAVPLERKDITHRAILKSVLCPCQAVRHGPTWTKEARHRLLDHGGQPVYSCRGSWAEGRPCIVYTPIVYWECTGI